MIKILDIRRACNEVLKANYPDVNITSKDFEKGFDRATFKVDFGEVKTATLDSLIEIDLQVVIYYFQNLKIDDLQLDLDEMKYQLPIVFGNKLKVLDRYLNINDGESVISDKVVVFTFNTLFYEDNPNGNGADAEFMRHLTINRKEVV